MKLTRFALRALLSCALAAPAAAQPFHDVAFTIEHGEGWPRVDTTVAASASRVVVATNHRLELRNASDGSVMLKTSQNPVIPQSFVVGSTEFPFEFIVPSSAWRDPRVEYDSANDRLWVVYWDGGRFIHIAVSVDSSPDTWDEWDPVSETGDWHYFTGSNALDLGDSDIPLALRVQVADHPIINVDDDYLYISVHDTDYGTSPPTERDAIASVPLTHTGGSMLSGAKPDESEIEIIQLQLLEEPQEPDFGMLHYAVQEPHEQFTDAQFFICTSEGPLYAGAAPLGYSGLQSQIRLAARYLDTGTSEWKWIFRDMDIDSTSPSPDHFFNSQAQLPDTPNSTWQISTIGSKFESAVLARNVSGAWRVFAGHHVVATSQGGGQPVDTTEFRYYVIDPDIAGFPGSWAPEIEVVGRAPTGALTGAQTYEGAIGVNENGHATITFTRSGSHSPSGWPSLVRARLTSDYSATQYEISAAFAQGPKAWYADASGAPDAALGSDYADMQVDPASCGYWVIGTIVDDPGDHEAPVAHTERAIWLTEIVENCNNAEMNGDGTVDAADLALFLDHYAKGAPQADMDGDGKVDTIDSIIYSDEYAKR